VRCPQDVHIADVMYTLKGMAIRARLYQDAKAPEFSQTFVDNVEAYGRSYEFGLATRHYLKHFPLRLPGMAPMGLGMLSKKRLDITPHRIEQIDQLQAILARAKELELAE
jgi:heterodisulfide reductase subunit C/quinone-modifying oxidoreductase subunit QmoC